MGNFAELITRLLIHLPAIAVWVAGITLCVHYRKNHPLASDLLVGAFVLFIVQLLAASSLQMWLLSAGRHDMSSLARNLSILQAVSTAVYLIGWALILAAIYQLLQIKKA